MSTLCSCDRSHRRYSPHSTGLGWPWPEHPACNHSRVSPTLDAIIISDISQPRQSQEEQVSSLIAQSRKNTLHSNRDFSASTAPLLSYSAPKKQSVEALVTRFETVDRLSRAPTLRLERAATNPAQFLRERYQAALLSQKRPSTDYRPKEALRRPDLPEEDIKSIERALRKRLSAASLTSISPKSSAPVVASELPKVKVKASARSISIIIPEGAPLPVVATIEAAGLIEVDTQMSTTQNKEGSQAGDQEWKPQQTNRRDTSSEGTSSQVGESQDITPNLGLPSLASRRTGPLTVSEASIPAPKSSDISVQGQVFIPAHEHPEKNVDVLHGHSDKTHERAENTPEVSKQAPEEHQHKDSQDPASPAPDTASAQAAASSETGKAENPTVATPRPPAHLFTQSESAVEVLAESFGKFGPPQPRSVPSIRIHRPSGTIMAASVGTTVLNSANTPATPVQAAVEQSPAALEAVPVNTPTAPGPEIPTPVDPVGNLSAVTDAAGTATSALPLPLPNLPVGGKKGKKKKVVRKARKLVLRKRILAIILGRELANVIHLQLNAVGNVASVAPLPVDGPNDLVNDYARRSERKRDNQRKQLDQKIAAARIHSEAEALHRCRICRGLTRTNYLRKYHRLRLKVEKPEMGSFERRATAMARVAAFKCRCTRRLLGVENELPVYESLPAQHLRAPAAIEPPLAGVDGAQQQ
ncbi:hypothetical protein H2200_004035 [Cladophialophora chaetospira]|uniref:Uncharacterized protein n=1 Tax=Cladophialophora chaetospira TaxID=386627 RepID=A0AA39CLP4_9EURO|nr:hypothetical protein H2200_004035 [Cladophialophora chaetospira]